MVQVIFAEELYGITLKATNSTGKGFILVDVIPNCPSDVNTLLFAIGVIHEKEIEYWRESGDYEKCIKLQKKLSTLYLNKKNGK